MFSAKIKSLKRYLNWYTGKWWLITTPKEIEKNLPHNIKNRKYWIRLIDSYWKKKNKLVIEQVLGIYQIQRARILSFPHELNNFSELLKIIEALLKCGVNINLKNNTKRTALWKAVNLFDNPDIIELFYRYDADFNLYDKDGKTLLMKSVSTSKNEKTLKALLEYGSNINAQNKEGKTALMMCKTANVCEFLISCGADINIKDSQGKTAVMCFLEYLLTGFIDDENETYNIIKILVEHGANINEQDKAGNTALISSLETYRKMWNNSLSVGIHDSWEYNNIYPWLTRFKQWLVPLTKLGLNVYAQNKFGKTISMFIYFYEQSFVSIEDLKNMDSNK